MYQSINKRQMFVHDRYSAGFANIVLHDENK